MKNSKQSIAIEAFNSGSNCAQSIVKAYAKDLNIDEVQALYMASGFGAGMGRLQNICGAVTGSFMVIGLSNSLAIQLEKNSFDLTSQMIQEFESSFKTRNKSTLCKDLIQCDLNTDIGQAYFKEHHIKEHTCQKCITDALDILEKIIS